MSQFWRIFQIMIYVNLAIGFLNASGIFTTHYMEQMDRVNYNISDMYTSVNQTKNESVMDSISYSFAPFLAGLGYIKDFAFNMFWMFGTLTETLGILAPIAAFLSTIVALSWFAFIIQLLLRWSFSASD